MTDKDTAQVIVLKQKIDSMKTHKNKMREFRQKIKNLGFKESKAITVGSRQMGNLNEDEDVFNTLYGSLNVIEPEYQPNTLYRLVEESSILPKSISAMVSNVPGFGYEYRWVGNGDEPKDGDGEKEYMKNIIDRANELESFLSVRRVVRRDMESTGNGYYEVTRFPTGKIAMIYRSNAVYTRIAPLSEKAVDVPIRIKRDGKFIDVIIKKRFRKFAYSNSSGTKIRWFKEFGDPRNMSYKTGEYNSSRFQATEMIHTPCVRGAGLYGQPRWIGNILGVMGVRDSDYINFDIFQNQGIPPIVVMVSGGMLTGESIDDLEDLLMSAKGKMNFNKIAILEAEDTSGQIDAQNKTKIEIKSLVEYRKEDSMFRSYSKDMDKSVRESFRLPPLYVGASSDFTYATAKTSRLIAEENVFKPDRRKEDEIFNNTIFSHIDNWQLRTKGPEIIRSDEMANMFAHMTNSGALNMNNAVDIVNQLFDIDLTKYEDEWAKVPIMIVRQLAKSGLLKMPDGVMVDPGEQITVPGSGYEEEPDPTGYNLAEDQASK